MVSAVDALNSLGSDLHGSGLRCGLCKAVRRRVIADNGGAAAEVRGWRGALERVMHSSNDDGDGEDVEVEPILVPLVCLVWPRRLEQWRGDGKMD